MMMRTLAAVVAIWPAFAQAQTDCAAAQTRFVAVIGQDKDDLFRADVDAAVADVESRWMFAVSAYLGAAIVIENGGATAEQGALLVATDPLLECWRPDAATSTEAELAQAQRVDTLLPADRRARLMTLAGELQ